MPSSRLDWTMAAAPDWESVRRRTSEVFCETLATCPTTPPVPMTVMPASTPSARPASMVMVWFQAVALLPVTRAEMPSMS